MKKLGAICGLLFLVGSQLRADTYRVAARNFDQLLSMRQAQLKVSPLVFNMDDGTYPDEDGHYAVWENPEKEVTIYIGPTTRERALREKAKLDERIASNRHPGSSARIIHMVFEETTGEFVHRPVELQVAKASGSSSASDGKPCPFGSPSNPLKPEESNTPASEKAPPEGISEKPALKTPSSADSAREKPDEEMPEGEKPEGEMPEGEKP
ncbi:MAG: hypothetical protein AAF492_29465, partial [Verrucomicrobiota bacterium]